MDRCGLKENKNFLKLCEYSRFLLYYMVIKVINNIYLIIVKWTDIKCYYYKDKYMRCGFDN